MPELYSFSHIRPAFYARLATPLRQGSSSNATMVFDARIDTGSAVEATDLLVTGVFLAGFAVANGVPQASSGENCVCYDFEAHTPELDFLPRAQGLDFKVDAPEIDFRVCMPGTLPYFPRNARSGNAYESQPNRNTGCVPPDTITLPAPLTIDMADLGENLGRLTVTGGGVPVGAKGLTLKNPNFDIDYDDDDQPVLILDDEVDLVPGSTTVTVRVVDSCGNVHEEPIPATIIGPNGEVGPGWPGGGGGGCPGRDRDALQAGPANQRFVIPCDRVPQEAKPNDIQGQLIGVSAVSPVKFAIRRSQDRRFLAMAPRRFKLSREGAWFNTTSLAPGLHSFTYVFWDDCSRKAGKIFIQVVPCAPTIEPVKGAPCSNITKAGYCLEPLKVTPNFYKSISIVDAAGLPLNAAALGSKPPRLCLTAPVAAGVYNLQLKITREFQNADTSIGELELRKKSTFTDETVVTVPVEFVDCGNPGPGEVPPDYPPDQPADQDYFPDFDPAVVEIVICAEDATAGQFVTRDLGQALIGATTTASPDKVVVEAVGSEVMFTLKSDICAGTSLAVPVEISVPPGHTKLVNFSIHASCHCPETSP